MAIKSARLDGVADNMISLARVIQLMKSGGPEDGIRPPLSPKYWVLWFLSKDNLSMSQLGKLLHRSKPNMTVIVNDLIKQGFVERLPKKDDMRVIKIGITQKGKKHILDKRTEVKGNIRENLLKLSEKEIGVLCSALEDVNRIVGTLVGEK